MILWILSIVSGTSALNAVDAQKVEHRIGPRSDITYLATLITKLLNYLPLRPKCPVSIANVVKGENRKAEF